MQEFELLQLLKLFGEVAVIKILYQFKKFKRLPKEQKVQESDTTMMTNEQMFVNKKIKTKEV